MPKTFFTADTHFCHNNIIKYCNRPFDNITAMNDKLIENWNSVVRPEDTVYHLGDFSLCYRKQFDEVISIARMLKGRKILIPGGHDKQILKVKEFKDCFVEVLPLHGTRLLTIQGDGSGEPFLLVMCHYPYDAWEKSYHGSIHLHGHSHGMLPRRPLRFDVGVDKNNFYPVHLDTVKAWAVSDILSKNMEH